MLTKRPVSDRTNRAARRGYPGAVPTSAQPPEGARPVPAPLDPPMTPFAVAGMAVWAVVGLALLPFRHALAANGRGSWLWICLAGFLLGIPGLLVMRRHDANRRRRRAGDNPAEPDRRTGKGARP
jgi:uncharacterized protein DUF2530